MCVLRPKLISISVAVLPVVRQWAFNHWMPDLDVLLLPLLTLAGIPDPYAETHARSRHEPEQTTADQRANRPSRVLCSVSRFWIGFMPEHDNRHPERISVTGQRDCAI